MQACADDPQVAVHAVRNLVRLGFGTVSVRWSQLGFGRTSSTSTTQETPRNLFGFKDGTANVKAEEDGAADEHVWVGRDDDPDAAWLAGGSYLVARRISMLLEVWDRQPLGDQEAFVGRTKGSGAPLSGGGEHTEPDFEMPGSDDQPVIAPDAHVRLVHPSRHGGARMLRRGYNFVDGSDPLGGFDAGLFFLAYVRDPRTHFVPAQRAMAGSDALMEYLEVTGSALFAVPPGIGPGEHVGQALFARPDRAPIHVWVTSWSAALDVTAVTSYVVANNKHLGPGCRWRVCNSSLGGGSRAAQAQAGSDRDGRDAGDVHVPRGVRGRLGLGRWRLRRRRRWGGQDRGDPP